MWVQNPNNYKRISLACDTVDSNEISQSQKELNEHGQIDENQEQLEEVHDETKPIYCAICDDIFTEENKLNEHVEIVHLAINNGFKCVVCNDSFAQVWEITRHIELVHESKKQFNCTECDNRFEDESDLTEHMSSVHEGRNQHYNCSIV